MPYRRLGRAGLRLSVFSFGSWISFKGQLDDDRALECMQEAYESGVNFFDNAEAYARGESERIMGRALRKLGWPRSTYVLSTKLFWGLSNQVNLSNTLNRKYLMQGIDGSLERLEQEFVDIVFCHRSDPDTPLEETVWAMHDIVSSGRALYWGTSEWSADEIRGAWEIAERHHLHKPVTEQPQYNLLHRDRVEREYARLYGDIGLGTTIWSPLAEGLLTGKYRDGIPEGSRAAMSGSSYLRDRIEAGDLGQTLDRLQGIADDLGCTLAQLALAWCAANPDVSTVITGASRVEQVRENMQAIEVLERLDEEVLERIDAAVG